MPLTTSEVKLPVKVPDLMPDWPVTAQAEEVIFHAPIDDICSESRVPVNERLQVPPEAEGAADNGCPETINPVMITASIPSPRTSLRSLGFNFSQR